MELLKILFFITRHCGLDPQSTANNVFNKGMLKQVQHDGSIFRSPLNNKQTTTNQQINKSTNQ